MIVAELVVGGKTTNPPGFRYGGYRVWGVPERSRYFDATNQPDAEPLLRSLSFRPPSPVLAHSFQGPGGLRDLTDEYERRIRKWSQTLPHFPPERISPGAVAAALLQVQQYALSSAGEFDPSSIHDARDRVLASIVRRRGQPEFRERLIEAYAGRCAISGCDAVEALEAAHILPYQGDQTNHPANGLLLRADLHSLFFDLGLITVDTSTKL